MYKQNVYEYEYVCINIKCWHGIVLRLLCNKLLKAKMDEIAVIMFIRKWKHGGLFITCERGLLDYNECKYIIPRIVFLFCWISENKNKTLKRDLDK